MELQAVRGMHDLLGDEIVKWTYVEEKIRAIFSALADIAEIRMPALEKIEVFTHTVGDDTDIVQKQMYTLTDVSSEKLVLRPEGTASFIRAVIEHQLHRTGHPQRYYYYLPMFRYERPQKGRLRQFHQFGGELNRQSCARGRPELIILLNHVFRAFGLKEYENPREQRYGCGDCRPQYKELLKDYFPPAPGRALRAMPETLRAIADENPGSRKREECRAVAKSAPVILQHLCGICRPHHAALKTQLQEAGVAFIEDPNIVRGLDYYMRTAFEFTSELLGAQSALGGGGRYDGLRPVSVNRPFPPWDGRSEWNG